MKERHLKMLPLYSGCGNGLTTLEGRTGEEEIDGTQGVLADFLGREGTKPPKKDQKQKTEQLTGRHVG